jgi:small subunit ribosomal protein S16
LPVRIRLKRMGSKGRPFYRVVVANSTSPRDGRFIEQIGYYDPMTDPSTVKIDADRALHWLKVGAQPTETVNDFLKKHGILERHEAAKSAAKAGAA